MPAWVSPLSPFRRPLDFDIRALAAAARRVETDIAAGTKRGRALGAVAPRHGLLMAARMHHATDARWRLAEMRAGGGPGAGRVVEAAVNRIVEDRGVRVLTAA